MWLIPVFFNSRPAYRSLLCVLDCKWNANFLKDNERSGSLFSVSFKFDLFIDIEYSMILNRSVSSTNDMIWNISLAFGRSFISIRNNKGPRMNACGMPVVISFWMIMYCDLILHTGLCLLGSYWTSGEQHFISHSTVICTEGFRDSGCRIHSTDP